MAKDDHGGRKVRAFLALAPWAAVGMLVLVLLVAGLPIMIPKSVSGAERDAGSAASPASFERSPGVEGESEREPEAGSDRRSDRLSDRLSDRVPRPQLIEARLGEHCVEPIPVIRRRHPEFLMHQRDRTVHAGIRGERHSLTGCIDCHAARDAQGQWLRIDAPGQFCESCHSYVAVEPDCFGCHSALPEVAFEEGGR